MTTTTIEVTRSPLFSGTGRARAHRRRDLLSHFRFIFFSLVFYLLFLLLSVFRSSWRRDSMVSRRSCSRIEYPSRLFILFLNSLNSSITSVLCFLVSNPAASFSGKNHISSPLMTETVCSVNFAALFVTTGSAQSECMLTGSTRLSTATKPPLPRFSVSPLTKGQNRSLTVAPANPHQLDYAAPPPFLSLIPTDLLIYTGILFPIVGVYGIYSTVPSDNSSDYANHSVRVSAKFNNGFGEENKFNCLTILLADNVAFRIHLISRVNIIGFRADLICLMGSLASIGFSPLFRTLSPGYFNVVSGYLKHLSSCGFKDTNLSTLSKYLLETLISQVILFYYFCCSSCCRA
ncbi:hypothetical protein HID58_093773 [Brassica napus]|uniref:Uncharacterized protein n=1 Tax=Brassica napus TaxID=3708 RepID=A0ABQ7XC85_BRANA|nr:hypothetical protein HID58_093773 [Brassica napus]